MLRAMFGFDHLPKTSSPAVGGSLQPWAAYTGYAGTNTNPTLAAVDSAGFLGAYSTAATVNVSLNMAGLIPANPSKVTFGFRLKTLQEYASAHGLIGLADSAAPNVFTAYLFQLGAGASPWLPTAGNEVYVEVTYDFVAFTTSILVNGATVTVTQGPAPSAAIKAAFITGNWSVNWQLVTTGTTGRYAIRDVYVVDSVAGDGMVAPIGAQRLFPIYPDDAAGAGWTSSNGMPLVELLNVPLPTSVNTSSPVDKAPLNLSFISTAPAGTTINAVSLSLAGASLGDGSSTTKCELSQGGTTLSAKYVQIPKTLSYGVSLGVYPKAPDGGAWTSSKVDGLALKLTPDTSA